MAAIANAGTKPRSTNAMSRHLKCIATLVAIAAALLAPPVLAQSASGVQLEFARAVYKHSVSLINRDRPQALLRAVVVLRVTLDDGDRWKAEVFRDNPEQPELTRRAIDSVDTLPPPTGLSPEARATLHGAGVIEAWLFQTDGHFALRTLALPQRDR
jgi:hypothetical protein